MTRLPLDVRAARIMAHAAIQLPYRAALANLSSTDDARHTTMNWAEGAFRTHAFRDGTSVELRLDPLTLGLGCRALVLNGVSYDAALNWLDQRLADRGHAPASRHRSEKDIPPEVSDVVRFSQNPRLTALADWFTLAQTVFEKIIATYSRCEPTANPIRCEPARFALTCSLAIKGPENAAITVGLSIGDGFHDSPYVYVSPKLAAASANQRHNDELVVTGDRLVAAPAPEVLLEEFLLEAVDSAQRMFRA